MVVNTDIDNRKYECVKCGHEWKEEVTAQERNEWR